LQENGEFGESKFDVICGNAVTKNQSLLKQVENGE
jgi:hypothetical protein